MTNVRLEAFARARMLCAMSSDDAPKLAPETQLLLAHTELWEGADALVLGAQEPEVGQLGLSATGASASPFDLAIVYLPKARRRREYLIALAASSATRIIVVGHKRSGIKPTTNRLRELGEVVAVEHGSHCQLVVVELEKVYAAPPLDDWEEVFEARGLELVTLPGVFCDGRLDDGSDLLLNHLRLPASGSLLDLGCGSGVLGLWAKRAQPALDVTLSDVDTLSVESARRSVVLNDLDVRCVVSDIYSAVDGVFDVIVTNPPFHQGVDTDYEVTRRIISDAPTRLRRGGELWLVANHFLPWREPLEEHFKEVELVHASSRFKIWRARRA